MKNAYIIGGIGDRGVTRVMASNYFVYSTIDWLPKRFNSFKPHEKKNNKVKTLFFNIFSN